MLQTHRPSCSSPTPLWSEQQQRHDHSEPRTDPVPALTETEQEFLRLLEGPGSQSLQSSTQADAQQTSLPARRAHEAIEPSPQQLQKQLQWKKQKAAGPDAAATRQSPPSVPLLQPPFYPAGRSMRVPVKTVGGTPISRYAEGHSFPQLAVPAAASACTDGTARWRSPSAAAGTCRVGAPNAHSPAEQQQQHQPMRRVHGALFHARPGQGQSSAAPAAAAVDSPRPPPPTPATPAAMAAGAAAAAAGWSSQHLCRPAAAGEELLALGHLLGTLSSWQLQRQVLLSWRGVAQVGRLCLAILTLLFRTWLSTITCLFPPG